MSILMGNADDVWWKIASISHLSHRRHKKQSALPGKGVVALLPVRNLARGESGKDESSCGPRFSPKKSAKSRGNRDREARHVKVLAMDFAGPTAPDEKVERICSRSRDVSRSPSLAAG